MLSDNQVGIQIHKTNFSMEAVVIRNATVVGLSTILQDEHVLNTSIGLITARTDGLAIEGISFNNFDTSMTAIQSCSQCEDIQYVVSGGRTTTFKRV